MPHIPFKYAPQLIWCGTRNFFTSKPVVISFETTLSCNADCLHCDINGKIHNETRMKPEGFRRYIDAFRPPVVQLYGGEPLLREDLLEVVRAVKINPFFPYTILVSNSWEMTLEKYRELKKAGVNQFSISLDFPDDRHDHFRQIPGLFAKMDQLIPSLAAEGNQDVVLNTAITSANVKELPAIVETARRWNVCLSFSIYTPLRTNNYNLVVKDPDDIQLMAEVFEKGRRREGIYATVVNSGQNLAGIMRFVRDGQVPNCSAGKRFMVVRPDGIINPCSLMRPYSYETQKEMLKEFTSKNKCGGCYVSIRSYVEVSFPKLLWENLVLRVFKS